MIKELVEFTKTVVFFDNVYKTKEEIIEERNLLIKQEYEENDSIHNWNLVVTQIS